MAVNLALERVPVQLETCVNQTEPNVDRNLNEFSLVSHWNEIDRCNQSPTEEPAHHEHTFFSFELAICSKSAVKAIKFLFEVFLIKLGFIFTQE